ncbi:putative lipid II flippase FtsW [Lachnospiraceae bacterium C1.1]|nr:putative lipid II flippase FtsW [Lachnospiraceae bacterium C1.1]
MVRKKTRQAAKSRALFVDPSMLIVVVLLLCFGLIMVYSASSYEASVKFNDSTIYLRNQLRASVLGIICMFVFSRIDYHRLKKFAPLMYIGSLLSVVAVMTPLGMTINGARRWIKLGPFSVQPAEIVKLALIVFFAAFICKRKEELKYLRGFVKCMIPALIPAGMIYVITSNLSSAIIVAGMAVVILFVASPRYWYYILGALLVFSAVFLVVYLVGNGILPENVSYRLTRVKAWLHPEAYASGSGFQTLQALYSIGSGGVTGKGLGQSVQKLGLVPEAQNDMIFSIICEELGLFGAFAVLLMFLILILRLLIVATNAPDLFGALLVVGVMGHISLQVILNIAVVTNVIPNTGVTLPFISYGGTSVLFLMAEIGIALNVSRAQRSN